MIPRLPVFILLCFILLSFKGDNLTSTLQRDGIDYAVFFAVKDYDAWDDLQTPIADAKAIAKVLKNKYGFKNEILENPTKNEIRQKIVELQRKQFKKDDQLLLFFTGHGEFMPFNHNPDKGKGYFIPADAKKNDPFRDSYLYYPDIKPDINDIDCEHIMIVIDACFSGSFFQYRAGGDDRPGRLSDRERLIQNSLKKRCRKGITSGGLKRTRDGIYHSPFTDKFLAGLNSLGGEDEVLTYNELYTNLEGLQDAPRRGYFGNEDSESKFLFIAKRQKVDDKRISKSAQRQADFNAWQKANNTNTIEAFRIYLSNHPNGLFTSKALQKIKTLEDETDWQIAQVLDTPSSYQEYVKNHPSGKYTAEVRKKTRTPKVTANNFSSNYGTFTDSRDGQSYKWIRMKDGKIWMAENLNYNTSDSYCYDNKSNNCNQYGRLYTWAAAKKACPSGWYLPSETEWERLLEKYGGRGKGSYLALIAGGTSEFQSLLGGYRFSDGEFLYLGDGGYYWSATDYGAGNACYYGFGKANDGVFRNNDEKAYVLSFRCIKD